MGAKIPKAIQETELSQLLSKAGLERFYQGKVRDTYTLPDHPDLLLVVASDRLSIYDFVLNCLVPQKGEVLTALTVFWLKWVFNHMDHHLVAYGRMVDQYLPPSLHNNPDLRKRGLVVRKLEIIDVEWVIRGYLTGSAWRYYQKTGLAYGYKLPLLLHDGSRLTEPIFTPTTHAESGHDLPLSAQEVESQYPGIPEWSLEIYKGACDYAFPRDIVIADTKFEFGKDKDGEIVLGDEVLTPDSSRFWNREEWHQAAQRGEAPSGYDKEPVRQEGRKVETPFSGLTGIHSLDAENPEHIAFVHQVKIPREVISATQRRYRQIAFFLLGESVESFQQKTMHIP